MNKSLFLEAAARHPQEILQPYAAMMELNGFDAICAFTEWYGGRSIYVPSLRAIFARCLEEEARGEFNGTNFAELSKKFGFTERHMRRVLGKVK